MATKSFTTDMKFNRKSADSLINALSSRRKVNPQRPLNVETIRDSERIKNMFKKR